MTASSSKYISNDLSFAQKVKGNVQTPVNKISNSPLPATISFFPRSSLHKKKNPSVPISKCQLVANNILHKFNKFYSSNS